jgi:glycosyltransferase involved in cell wall biosynthesis
MAAEGMELSDSGNVMIADDSESFAKRVIELLGDPGSRERLGANGLKLMHERYSWTKIYGGLDAVFERAVSRRSAAAPPRPPR